MLRAKTSGIVTVVMGACLSALALYAGNYLSGIKGFFLGIGRMVGTSKVGAFLGGEASKKVALYDTLVKGCFWTGVALMIIGIIVILKSKKR